MSKNEFLDILRDYLKDSFSQSEILDILRDYEEFFLNGELEGKSDEEIIASLGSPKTIAQDLKEEMKRENRDSKTDKDYKDEAKKVWEKTKETSKKGFQKGKEFLNSNDIINEKIPTWGVKAILIILSLLLIIPSIMVIGSVIGAGLGLVGLSVLDMIGYAVSFPAMAANFYLGLFAFFISLAGTGVIIALWTIYVNVVILIKRLFTKYIAWIKTKKMYIRVKENKNSNRESSENEVRVNVNEERKEEENNEKEDTIVYLEESKIVEVENFEEKEAGEDEEK